MTTPTFPDATPNSPRDAGTFATWLLTLRAAVMDIWTYVSGLNPVKTINGTGPDGAGNFVVTVPSISGLVPKDAGSVGVGAFFVVASFTSYGAPGTPTYSAGSVYSVSGTSRCISCQLSGVYSPANDGTMQQITTFQRIA